jgi:diacylglycerol kinase (ATP)
MQFDRVVVIFNPHSTGRAPQLAEQLQITLADRLPNRPVRLCPTERAGHARELAAGAATSGRPLIVSVSGDGGYNEVVDGVMHAGNQDVVYAVMAAGNANDYRKEHRRTAARRRHRGGRDPVHRPTPAHDRPRTRRLRPLRALLHRDGPHTDRGHRLGEGREGLVQGDRVRGAILRPVPTLHDRRTARRSTQLRQPRVRQHRRDGQVRHPQRERPPHDGRFEVITLPHTAKWRIWVWR